MTPLIAVFVFATAHLVGSSVFWALTRGIIVCLPRLAPKYRHTLALWALALSAVIGFAGFMPALPAMSYFELPLSAPPASASGLMALVALVWGVGSLWFAIKLSRSINLMGHILSSARPLQRPKNAIWLARALGLKLTNQITSPQVAGLTKSVVLVPEEMEAELDDESVRGLIEHECAHIERGDLRVALAQKILLALFWWSPAMRALNAELDLQREMACDDIASERHGNARAYASSILDVADRVLGSEPRGFCAAAVAERSSLAQRMRRLIDRPSSVDHPALAVVIPLVMLVSFAGLAVVTPRASFAASTASVASLQSSPELVEAIGTQTDTVVQALLDAGADPNTRLEDGRSPLSQAISTSRTNTIAMVLRAGADADISMPNGEPVLHAALRSQIIDNVELLLEFGADAGRDAPDGTTALSLAMQSRNEDLIELIMSQSN